MSTFRALTPDEIRTLEALGSRAAPSWDVVTVRSGFDPTRVANCFFDSEVRIGRLDGEPLQYDGMSLPVGLYGSYIGDCTIGDNCAIYNVRYLKRYIIAERCLIFDVHELRCTPDATFGNSAEMSLMNEAGNRSVTAFAGMLPADAYLWAKYADDAPLQQRLSELSSSMSESMRGRHGRIGLHCVIKGAGSIRNTMIGSYCQIENASRISEVSILSGEDERVVIGENVILSEGIIGPQSKALHGCMAFKFVLGENCTLKYGARLMESVVGDNSTIACCESSNNLIFPAHEQHHNNSFLIASCIQGQSNIAAGATIGSNHNSRTADGEILAGRGFWPGLCCSLKHSSRFASYTLIAKGSYPAEICLPLPFCLLSNGTSSLDIMPAYWWMHNMYALARNNWKFSARDRRLGKSQHIEFSAYAPDSMEEALSAYQHLLSLKPSSDSPIEIPDGGGIEHSRRSVRYLKPLSAIAAYKEMLIHYFMSNFLSFGLSAKQTDGLFAECGYSSAWVNLGGQLISEADCKTLRADIASGELKSWGQIHERYDTLWEQYPTQKLLHAYGCICRLFGVESLSRELWRECIFEEKRIQQLISDRVRSSREKDYSNPWRQATFESDSEMNAVIGRIEDDKFISQISAEARLNTEKMDSILKQL